MPDISMALKYLADSKIRVKIKNGYLKVIQNILSGGGENKNEKPSRVFVIVQIEALKAFLDNDFTMSGKKEIFVKYMEYLSENLNG